MTTSVAAWIAVWVGAYFIAVPALLFALVRLPRSRRLPDARCGPVSVVVSARNEERDLPACLDALAALDYPRHILQIVLVDDRSTDATGSLIDAFAAKHPHAVAIHTAALPDNGLEAKARGIAHGFARATGAWVLITDADARVAPGWVRHLLGDADEGVGMVGGAVVAEPRGLVGLVERVSWAFVQIFSAGAAGLGFPFICLGPNMGVRRAMYLAAGGLERADFRVAEDLALTRMVARAGLRSRAYLDAETTATLVPVPSFAHLVSQQRRWLGGGVEQGWAYRISLGLVFGWGFGVAAFFALGWMLSPGWWGVAIAARTALDAAALLLQRTRMRLGAQLRYLPVMEVYVVLIFLLLPLSLLVRRRVAWRGEGYVVRYGARVLVAALALGASAMFAQSKPGPKAPSPAATAPSPPPPTLTMRQAPKSVVLELGPIDLPATGGHAAHGAMGAAMAMPETPPLWVTIPADGWFHGYTVELVDKTGAKVPQQVLHHVNVIATGQRELFSPIMLRLAAAGPETQEIKLPRLIGVRVVRGDSLLVRAMFHNESAVAFQGVRVRVRFPFTPASAWIGALRIQPFYMDVTAPQRSHVFDLPPGRTERFWESRPAVKGRILGFSGHTHKYATELRLEDRTSGKVLWRVRPDTNARGELVALPIQRFIGRLGISLDPTHTYRLSVVYQNPTGALIRDGGMGALGGVFLVGRGAKWPGIDANDPVYREDVRGMSTP